MTKRAIEWFHCPFWLSQVPLIKLRYLGQNYREIISNANQEMAESHRNTAPTIPLHDRLNNIRGLPERAFEYANDWRY